MKPRPLDTLASRRVIEWIDREESKLFWAASLLVLLIALLDALVFRAVSLGAWYILPLLIFACVLDRLWLIVIALTLSLFREMLSNPVPAAVSAARFAIDWALFSAAGWFMSELIASRRLSVRLIADLQHEIALRQGAETELHLLFDMAPLSILTADSRGIIVRANATAGTLFGVRPASLVGMELSQLVPMLARIPDRGSSNMSTQCTAFRADGQVFLANVWFRRMDDGAADRTVVLVSDESDNVRLRRDEALELGVSGSRALLGAVAVQVQQALEIVADLHAHPEASDDLLGRLRNALRQILELTPPAMVGEDAAVGPVNPGKLLEEFQAFCCPMFEDLPIGVTFDIPARLPLVSSSYSALVQLLLVLVRMSHRRLRQAARGEVRISADVAGGSLQIRVWDSSVDPEREPDDVLTFSHPDAMALLIARASLRAAGGEVTVDREGFLVSVPLIAPKSAGWNAASNSD